MKSGPSLTIFLPVHNGGHFVHEAVASVLRQTSPDFELVILENQSTDGTAEWLRSLQDCRVQVIPSPTLLPMEKNWNRSLEIARTPLITFLCHDDILEPTFVEDMLALVEHDEAASIWQSFFRVVDEDGQIIRDWNCFPPKENVGDFLLKSTLEHRESYATGYVIRTTDFRQVGGFPEFPGLLYSDHAMWLSLTTISHKASIQKYGYRYRKHSTNASKTSHWTMFLEAATEFMKFLDRLSKTSPEVGNFLAQHGLNYFVPTLGHWLSVGAAEADETGKPFPREAIRDAGEAIRTIWPDQDFHLMVEYEHRNLTKVKVLVRSGKLVAGVKLSILTLCRMPATRLRTLPRKAISRARRLMLNQP